MRGSFLYIDTSSIFNMNEFMQSDLVVEKIITGQKYYSYAILSPEMSTQMGLESRDYVGLRNQETEHHTCAIILNNGKTNVGQNSIRLSWYASQNLAASPGDRITIYKVFPRSATKIYLVEISNRVKKLHNSSQLAAKLQGYHLTRGDMISFRNTKQNALNIFMVMKFEPNCEVAIISEGTKIVLGFE